MKPLVADMESNYEELVQDITSHCWMDRLMYKRRPACREVLIDWVWNKIIPMSIAGIFAGIAASITFVLIP